MSLGARADIFLKTSYLTTAKMTAHDEGVQAQSSDLTNTPQSNYNQDNGGETKEAQANKRESQSIQPESQGRDHKQENDDGKDKVKKQEESNDEHANEGKEKFEKEASQQQSEEGKSDSGNNNGGSKPKVSKEALEGPQSPAPTTKYDFDAEAKNGMCC